MKALIANARVHNNNTAQPSQHEPPAPTSADAAAAKHGDEEREHQALLARRALERELNALNTREGGSSPVHPARPGRQNSQDSQHAGGANTTGVGLNNIAEMRRRLEGHLRAVAAAVPGRTAYHSAAVTAELRDAVANAQSGAGDVAADIASARDITGVVGELDRGGVGMDSPPPHRPRVMPQLSPTITDSSSASEPRSQGV